MLESMVEWMNYPMYYAYEGAQPPIRAGAAHATIYPYGPFNAGDGKSVMLGLQNEREWASFCAIVLRASELATDERFKSNSDRVANRNELKSIIDHAFSKLTAEQVVELLEEAQIANAHVNDMHDVWNHPQLKARDRWVSVGTSEGAIPALLPPGRTNAFKPRMDAVPGLGQHSASILAELGFSDDRIQKMRQAKAI
jgi:itaconate CoA-transferase